MRILIYGLGAVGTVFATFLKENGHEVYAITKEKYLSQIKDNIVLVEGIWGKHHTKLDGIFSSVNYVINIDFDLIIISVKAYDTKSAVLDIKPLVKENTFVLLAQNGYGNYEIASKILGKEHTLLARVIFGSKVIKQGHVEVTVNADDVIIGQPDNAVDEEKVIKIAYAIKHAGIPASYSPKVYQILWDKILYNSALNPLGAVLECSYGDLAYNPGTKNIMNNIIKEIFKVAKANNIKLQWNSAEEYINFFYTKLIPPTKEHYPSMYYDIKSGKKTEIDALNGAIVKLAERSGINVPVNQTITNLLKFKEKQSLC